MRALFSHSPSSTRFYLPELLSQCEGCALILVHHVKSAMLSKESATMAPNTIRTQHPVSSIRSNSHNNCGRNEKNKFIWFDRCLSSMTSMYRVPCAMCVSICALLSIHQSPVVCFVASAGVCLPIAVPRRFVTVKYCKILHRIVCRNNWSTIGSAQTTEHNNAKIKPEENWK